MSSRLLVVLADGADSAEGSAEGSVETTEGALATLTAASLTEDAGVAGQSSNVAPLVQPLPYVGSSTRHSHATSFTLDRKHSAAPRVLSLGHDEGVGRSRRFVSAAQERVRTGTGFAMSGDGDAAPSLCWCGCCWSR